VIRSKLKQPENSRSRDICKKEERRLGIEKSVTTAGKKLLSRD
jgi:hypothetical protein